MTHEELGITKAELAALRKVRNALAGGRYKHIKTDRLVKIDDEGGKLPHKQMFNMAYWEHNVGCGTVCCIGGWMHNITHTERSASLGDLFYPDLGDEDAWDRVTPKRAVRAIDSFLKTGDPKWERVVP